MKRESFKTAQEVMRTLDPVLTHALDRLAYTIRPESFSLDGVDPHVAYYFGQLESVAIIVREHWSPPLEAARVKDKP